MDYAFTDRDVRENPNLNQAAQEYLRNYKGNFEPMLAALGRISQGADLEVAHVRMVLNVMRADPNVRIVREDAAPLDNVIPIRRRYEEQLHVPKPERERLQQFTINGRIKEHFKFGMSTWKTVEVVHYLDHDKTKFIFKRAGTSDYTRSKGWHTVWQERIEVQYGWVCSSKVAHVRFLTSNEAAYLVENGHMRMCPTCSKILLT